jgi:hypothetical protein
MCLAIGRDHGKKGSVRCRQSEQTAERAGLEIRTQEIEDILYQEAVAREGTKRDPDSHLGTGVNGKHLQLL